MEKPGFIKKKFRRIKAASLFLSSCFLAGIIITVLIKIDKTKKMETRGSVKGILKNNTGKPVADAVVMIKDGSHEFNDIASVSNSQGEFFVSGIVIPGTYTLQIEHATGSITKEINVQSADSVIEINF